MEKAENLKVCKRCRKRQSKGSICQACKTELLSNFEAAADWQIAYEMERAQLYTSKYCRENEESDC